MLALFCISNLVCGAKVTRRYLKLCWSSSPVYPMMYHWIDEVQQRTQSTFHPSSPLLEGYCHSLHRWSVCPIHLCSCGWIQWRRNDRGGVSNHWRLDCLLSRLFRRRSKKTSKLRVTGLCEGNPPVPGGFPSQKMASYAENIPFDDVIVYYRFKAQTMYQYLVFNN